jgi:hypothetical protein
MSETNGTHEPSPERIEAFMQDQIDLIAEHGWTVIAVFGDEDDNQFAYTVGLADHDVELVVVGLDPVRAHGILGAARKAIIDGKVILPPALVSTVVSYDVLAPLQSDVGDPTTPLPVSFNRITAKENVPVNVAHALEGDREWMLWQLCWPDTAGRLPDHPDYDLTLLRSQVMPGR